MADREDFATAVGALIKPLAYDSGVRNVTSWFKTWTTWTGGGITLHRLGRAVEFVCNVRRFDTAGVPTTPTTLCTLPSGFRPRATYRFDMHRPAGVEVEVGTDGTVKVVTGTIATGAYVTFKFSHATADAPPTVLPGI